MIAILNNFFNVMKNESDGNYSCQAEQPSQFMIQENEQGQFRNKNVGPTRP